MELVSIFFSFPHFHTAPSQTVVSRSTYNNKSMHNTHTISSHIIIYVYEFILLLRSGRTGWVTINRQRPTQYVVCASFIYIYRQVDISILLPSTELWLRWLQVLSHPFPRQPNPKGTKDQAESSKPLFILNIQFLLVFFYLMFFTRCHPGGTVCVHFPIGTTYFVLICKHTLLPIIYRIFAVVIYIERERW